MPRRASASSPPQPGGSRRPRRAGRRVRGASRAPRHTHHYGITVGHRSRHLLAQHGWVHGWRRGTRDTARGRGSRGGPAPGGGAGPRPAGARAHTGTRARTPGGPAPTRPAGKARELVAGEAGEEAARARRSEVAAAACPAAAESGCFPSRGAAVAARVRKVARAAPRRPWAAFKGRRGPAREPGTGRGPGWSAASCSACPAPRPLEGGGRLGGEGRACPGCGVREGGVLWALLDRKMGGTGVVRACQVTGACDIPGPPCSQPPAARPGAGWTVRPRSMEDWVMESVFHSWRILSENPSKVRGKILRLCRVER